MTKEEMVIKGCMFAVNEMIGNGSNMFAHRKDGKWETMGWREILEYLNDKLEAQSND